MWPLMHIAEGVILGVVVSWLVWRSGPALRWVLSRVRSGRWWRSPLWFL